MSDKPPVWIGRDLRALVPSQLEQRLTGARVLLKEGRGWSPSAHSRGLFFDLSRVEWVELGALVQLVLLVDSALREHIPLTLALPLGRLRQSEMRWLGRLSTSKAAEAARRPLERRLRVRSYLEHLQLLEALNPVHLQDLSKNLTILQGFDSSEMADVRQILKEEQDLARQLSPKQTSHEEWPLNERQYRHVFPLNWFSIEDSSKMQALSWAFANVIGSPWRGLETVDANTLANVVLYELVENVKDHSGTSGWALVAAWARPRRFPAKTHNYYNCEHPYLEWVNQGNSPVVEIVVGDSGVGIQARLRKRFNETRAEGIEPWPEIPGTDERLLLWAFNRWSTSKDLEKSRGTRGLYRVDRVVKKYQGLITLRSSGVLAGLDHGGAAYDAPIYETTPLAHIPGTILRVRMPALREEFPHRTELPRRPASLAFLTLDFGVIAQESFTDRHRQKIMSALRKLPSDQPVCLIITIRGAIGSPKGVEAVIREAMELRHPVTLVLLGLPGGLNVLENAVDSINTAYEAHNFGFEGKGSQHYEVWDPVLVLSEPTRYFWAGVTSDERKILTSLSESRGGWLPVNEFRTLISDPKIRRQVLRSFRNDPGLIQIREDGGLEIAITVEGIVREVSSLLIEHVETRRSGVVKGGPFRTPTLHTVDYWLEVEKIFETLEISPELAGFCLASLVRRPEIYPVGGHVEVVVDSSVPVERARCIASYAGSGDPQMVPVEARAVGASSLRMVPRGTRVIVHCDVLLSEESARRCISQVLRDEAIPIALSCVFDARESAAEVELWGVKTPVFSLARVCMLVSDNHLNGIRNINPVTRRIEEEEEDEEKEEDVASNEASSGLHEPLWQIAFDAKALNFTHLRRSSGRHFTFSVDADRLALEPVVLEAFQREVMGLVPARRAGSRRSSSRPLVSSSRAENE